MTGPVGYSSATERAEQPGADHCNRQGRKQKPYLPWKGVPTEGQTRDPGTKTSCRMSPGAGEGAEGWSVEVSSQEA